MRIHVDMHSRSDGDAAPGRFRLGNRTIEVVDLLDRWQGKDTDYFRVLGDDEHTYVLKLIRSPGSVEPWEIVSFTHKDSRGTRPGELNDTTLLQ